MTDTIQIHSGEKHIAIERDGKQTGEIVINPSDVLFAEKFYRAMGDFESKLDEYQKRNDGLEAIDEKLSLLHEACEFIRGRIDEVFGAGTSQAAFGDTLNLDVFSQFFQGITPHVKQVRSEKIAAYIPQSRKPANGTGRKSKKKR